ncbi:2-dehydro-3-deoxy-6-phosphogalactonate aldolase, partial [Geobacillus sp. BMUD]|nr:2-dehydro-3-deoxy-6-phosphogalactonate aldolase [Geobacillus sp. BMUD]
KSIKAVLPEGTQTFAVGGASAANFAGWFAAGVDGFGIGSALYKPGTSVDDIKARAKDIVAAYDAGKP